MSSGLHTVGGECPAWSGRSVFGAKGGEAAGYGGSDGALGAAEDRGGLDVIEALVEAQHQGGLLPSRKPGKPFLQIGVLHDPLTVISVCGADVDVTIDDGHFGAGRVPTPPRHVLIGDHAHQVGSRSVGAPDAVPTDSVRGPGRPVRGSRAWSRSPAQRGGVAQQSRQLRARHGVKGMLHKVSTRPTTFLLHHRGARSAPAPVSTHSTCRPDPDVAADHEPTTRRDRNFIAWRG